MALVIEGRTKCRLCREEIRSASEALAFPAFIPEGHLYSSYSDSAYHRECFSEWQHRAAFVSLYEAYRHVWESRPAGLPCEEAAKWLQDSIRRVFSAGIVSE